MIYVTIFAASIFINALPVLVSFPVDLQSNGSSSFNFSEANNKLCLRFVDFHSCSLELVETIPENLTFPADSIPRSTLDAWQWLLRSATEEIDISAYKLSLRGKDQRAEYIPGEKIFDEILHAGQDRGVKIRIAENYPQKDVAEGVTLQQKAKAEVRPVDYTKIVGSGILHTKFIVVDQVHFYLGSANMDWRSLNEKMELGILVRNCPCLGADLKTVFDAYWRLSTINPNSTTKLNLNQMSNDSHAVNTSINASNPLRVQFKGTPMDVYLASSPVILNRPGRTWDLDAILDTINSAESYIYIHLMDYIPMMVYVDPQRYWPVIDDALRSAALDRGVELKLMISALHFTPKLFYFLKSLQALDSAARLNNGSIEVKIFKVPATTEFQRQMKGDRRTHNKFMVTEDKCIIGTSNWAGDYFLGTAGVALVMHQKEPLKRPFIDQIRGIFIRDWRSEYTRTLDAYMADCVDGSPAGSKNDLCESADAS